VQQGVPGHVQVAAGGEQVLGQVVGGEGGVGSRVGQHGVVTLVGDHHYAGTGRPLRIHDKPGVDAVAHQLHIPVTPGDIGAAPADERHLGPVHREPGGDVRTGTAAVRGYRGRGVAALGQREGRPGDRVSHQVTNDDDARHVVTTSIPNWVGDAPRG